MTAIPLTARTGQSRWLEWPCSAWLFGLALLGLYLSGLIDTSSLWFTDEHLSHGVFIFPVCAFLIYLQREQIVSAERRQTGWGLLPLGAGVLLQSLSYMLQLKSFEMASLILALLGGILLLHGPELWKIVQFPTLYLMFAFPMPTPLVDRVSLWVQSVSTSGCALLLQAWGLTFLRRGNEIEIPGQALEVADACSGFKKLIALIAFAFLYGYLFSIPVWKRIVLVAAAIPIAVVANALRVAGLVAVASYGGETALHRAHDWGEVVALIIAFILFVLVGKALGCKTLRFMPSVPS